MREKPRPQELYRHFKGMLYQIVTIAIHSETREEMVVYQALYGDFKTYVRPIDMFMSEVDRNKYPDVAQKMRFEKVDASQLQAEQPSAAANKAFEIKEDKNMDMSDKKADKQVVSPETNGDDRVVKPDRSLFGLNFPKKENTPAPFTFDKTPPKESAVMSKSIEEEAEDLNLDPLVIQFMDADLAVDKNDILTKLRPTITNDMIDIMALSLGVVVKEGDVYDRFNDLRTCLTTMEKYESTRLRS